MDIRLMNCMNLLGDRFMNYMSLLGDRFMKCMVLLGSLAIKDSGRILVVLLGVFRNGEEAVSQRWSPATYLR